MSESSTGTGYPVPSDLPDRQEIFNHCFNELGIDKRELARIMFLGEKPGYSNISKIHEQLAGKPTRGVTKQAALAIQLLVKLKAMGVDPTSLKFLDKGWLE